MIQFHTKTSISQLKFYYKFKIKPEILTNKKSRVLKTQDFSL